MTEVRFIEERDYEIINTKFGIKPKRGRPKLDWMITVEMAKKLHKFMVSRLDLDTGLNE